MIAQSMTPDAMAAFFVFALVAAVTPGPSNVMVLAAGARAGLRGGLPCLAGVVAGMALLIGVAALGLGGVITALPGAMVLLRWGGAALLLWLAWKIASAPPMAAGARGDPVGFWHAFAFQWVNPKSWIVGASAAATYGAGAAAMEGAGAATMNGAMGGAGARALLMGALFGAAAAPSCLLWLAFGSALQRVLADARRARVFNAVMGALLAASVVFVVT
jgi:threonine/homoserine/homoserine lactone efflux protein